MSKRAPYRLLAPALMGLATLLANPSSARPAHEKPSPQKTLDRFAQTLGYQMAVIDNTGAPDCPAKQLCFDNTLTLKLPKSLPAGDWSLYIGFVEPMQPARSDAFELAHINGDLYRLSPKPGVVLKPGTTYTIGLTGLGHQFSQYFNLPNAYVASGNLKPAVIVATRPTIDPDSGQEILPFVTPMTDEGKLATQVPADATQWLTPQRLFLQNAQRLAQTSSPEFVILPAPVSARHLDGAALDLRKGIRVHLTGTDMPEVQAALAGLKRAGVAQAKSGIPVDIAVDASSGAPESYHLTAANGRIVITAADSAGASYALRSLAQQAAFEHGRLKALDITDAPRFSFRGLHLDLARNFQSKAHILAVIEQMGAYKLNRLHLHLGDDEGWRLVIPGLPELTDIGSKRCHDPKEDTCLLPQLGAGPDPSTSVNGYLTRADYIEILKAARARHIDVIPSFDMPGHSRAAVRAMEARARRLIAEGKLDEAATYRLVEPNDTTIYRSIQNYNDNTLDICLPSTYAFIDKVMEEIKAMHAEAGLPLRRYHIGTDETAGAWTGSPACQKLMADEHLSVAQLGTRFITQVSDMLGDKGIEPAGWSDGMAAVDPAKMPKVVQSNSWGSLFGGGVADAYAQANRGWDVIMSTPDVLYLDMPNAPDPAERGYDWASRTTDLYKVFAFMPENLAANAALMTDTHAKGQTISDPTPLSAGHRIAGMQGQLWSETVRSDHTADYMLFPRTLAVAERAWHKADWEPDYVPGKAYAYGDGSIDTHKLLADWQDFQDRLTPQLAALDRAGLTYRLPLPGARVTTGVLEANVGIAGLRIDYRTGKGKWRTYHEPVPVTGTVSLRTVSPDGKRFSRIVTVK